MAKFKTLTLRPKRYFFLLAVFLFLLTLFPFASKSITYANPNAAISLGITEIGEGIDFSTLTLGLPWDMDTEPYPGFSTTFGNIDRASFQVSNGHWVMNTTNTDPNIWLLWPSIINTQSVLKLGDRYPIYTGQYRLFSMRLCSNVQDFANLYWYNSPLSPTGTPDGISRFIKLSPGCKVYTVDLQNMETFSGAWAGNVMGFRLDPAAVNPNASLQLDWVRLTTANTSNVVPIQWSSAEAGVNLHFYLSRTGCGEDGMLVGIAYSAATNGTFQWGSSIQQDPYAAENWEVLPFPESFQPGQYYVYMREGYGPPVCAGSQINIHKAPLLNFQKPSMYSGPDYALDIVNDPWGMSNMQDIASSYNFSTLYNDNGLMYGTTGGGDSRLYLRVTNPIDTNKYKYATFRYTIDALRNFGDGWVQRFLWWYTQPHIDPVTTEDMIIYEGWHTYSFDLSQAIYEPGGSWSGNLPVFRMDPHEISFPVDMRLDFLTLTGDERISSGTLFPIVYETNPEEAVTVSFYYDTDRNATNGRTPIVQTMSPTAPADSNFVYLPTIPTRPPIVSGGPPGEINLLTGETRLWNTAGVPPGTYYISADVYDGVMITTWYSEVPVIIE